MNMDMMQQVQGWIQQEFANKQMMSKDQLAQDAQSSNLPAEAKQQIQQLPQGNYSQNDIMGKVQGMMGSAKGMMGGMGGGQGGRGL
jgi:hypothetical protein